MTLVLVNLGIKKVFLICVVDPPKVGSVSRFRCLGLVPALCLIAAGRVGVAADEDQPHIRFARTRRKRGWFKSSAASREKTWCGRALRVRGTAPPTQCTGDGARDSLRHCAAEADKRQRAPDHLIWRPGTDHQIR
jgi:hypothetical protein